MMPLISIGNENVILAEVVLKSSHLQEKIKKWLEMVDEQSFLGQLHLECKTVKQFNGNHFIN